MKGPRSGTRRLGPFLLDPEQRTLARDGQPIELQPKVFDLLVLLAEHPGRIFGKAELLEAVWPGVHVTEASLHQALRKLRRALDDDPDAPAWVEAVSRRGWRWIGPSEVVVDSDLVGRAAELAALDALVVPGAIVCVHGPGGVGKTRLAQEWAARAGRRAWFVAAGGAFGVDDVLVRVAERLGAPLDLDRARLAEVTAAAGELVIVLDEVDPVATELGAVLAELPGPAWLLTSRRAVAGARTLELGGLEPADAGTLLVARSRAPRPLAPPEVAALVEPLDGSPLAIELAAARLRLLAPADLAERLRGSLSVLGSERVWASIGATLALLDPADRALLEACAVFPGRFTAAELEGVAGGEVLDGLERLLDASLVVPDEPGASALRVVPLVRDHARAAAVGRLEGLRERWAAGLVAAAEPEVERAMRWVPEAFGALRQRLDDWVAGARTGPPALRGRLATAVGFACRYAGPWGLADELLRATAPVDPVGRLIAAEYSLRLGRAPAAAEVLAALIADPGAPPIVRGAAAVFVARQGGLEAASLTRLGVASLPLTRLGVASLPLTRLGVASLAIGLGEEAGSDALVALGLDAAGATHRRGDVDEMRRCYDRALGRLDHPDGRIVRAVVAANYGAALAQLGRWEEAAQRLRIALDAAETAGLAHLASVGRMNLAAALLEGGGRAEEAAPLLEIGLAEARRLGDQATVASRSELLALATAILGDGRRSEQLLDEAWAARPHRDPAERALFALRRVWAALARGDADLARSRMESALALAATDVQRAHGLFFAYGLARVLGDEVRAGELAPRARAAAGDADPELVPWLDAWGAGAPRPASVGPVPIDVWVLATR